MSRGKRIAHAWSRLRWPGSVRVDILVNNAGRGMKYVSEQFMTKPTRFWETDPNAWRLVIDTNVNGTFLMASAAVPPMLRQRWGRIVNISMNYETMRRAGFSPYGPSKAAVESETIIWAQDLDGTGVTVNALLPGGATLTGMIPAGFPDAMRAALLDPTIMVPPLLWLVSPASDGITGKRLVANEWPSSVNPNATVETASARRRMVSVLRTVGSATRDDEGGKTVKTMKRKTAPYGSWKSPITSDLIVAQSIGLSGVLFDGEAVYWLEARPQEQGRNVVVRAGASPDDTTDIVPKPFNVRTRAHEYGGGAWAIADGILYFSNFTDGRLYRLTANGKDPEPLTPAPPGRERDWRFADGIIDQRRQRWIGVREDHTGEGSAVNAIVAVDLAQPGSSPGRILAGGHDFFSSPRLSPDGRRLAWLAWDHPNMPWNGTSLYLAELADDGAIVGTPLVVAGGPAEFDLPAGMVTGRSRPRLCFRSFGLVEPVSLHLWQPVRYGRSPRWRRSSASRNGISAWRPTPSSDLAGSSAPMRRPASAIWPRSILRPAP